MLLHLAGRCFYLARCSPSPRLLDRLSPAGRPSEVLVARVQLTSAQTALHAAARRRRARAHASLVRQKLVGTDEETALWPALKVLDALHGAVVLATLNTLLNFYSISWPENEHI